MDAAIVLLLRAIHEARDIEDQRRGLEEALLELDSG